MTDAPPSAGGPPTQGPSTAGGRPILSRALVLAGPDGRVTVRLRDGRTLLLQRVTAGPAEFCGEVVAEQASQQGPCRTGQTKHCGPYEAVAAALPGDSGWTFDPGGRCVGGPNLDP